LAVLRFFVNLVLAVVLIVLSAAVIAIGAATVLAQTWESHGLDYEAEGGRWIWIDEQPIYVWEEGASEAPTVVFVHGLQPEGMATWSRNLESLTKRDLHVVAVDLKGCGHSMRDTDGEATLDAHATLLAKALNELGIRGATLVANGWGSAVAMELIQQQPQFVSQLVLISPDLEPGLPEQLLPALDMPFVSPAIVWTMYSGGPYDRYVQRQGFSDPAALDPDLRRALRRPSQIEGTIACLGNTLASIDAAATNQLPAATDVPALVLVGRDDRPESLAATRAIIAEMPDAKLIVIADASRLLHIEQSSRANRYIAEYALYGTR